jgi:hypothetical protein
VWRRPDGYLQTHCIDPKLLRADAFELFMKDREQPQQRPCGLSVFFLAGLGGLR